MCTEFGEIFGEYSEIILLAKFRYKKYFAEHPMISCITGSFTDMGIENFSLKHILGLKVNDLRRKHNLSFQELSEKSGLSISYLSEIEKGKKSPKGDKILSLANALHVSYDELVSLKVTPRLQPIIDLLQSPFFKEFPLETFGLDGQKIVELLSAAPDKVSAFTRSVINIARNYEMRGELFYHAALRSFQELHDNYFQDIEAAATELRKKFGLTYPLNADNLQDVLMTLGYTVDRQRLSVYPSLRDVRSVRLAGEKVILLHEGLTPAQETFMLAREVGYLVMKIEQRPNETPPQDSYSFEYILNNYKASYFSAALILPEDELIRDIRKVASANKWDQKDLPGFLEKYQATPEMLMQRLTNLLPRHFGLKNLFFLRFVGTDNFNEYRLTKELHLSRSHSPHSNNLNEHYCRRWLSIRLIKNLRSRQQTNDTILSGAQISRYYSSNDEYLCLTMAFPNVSNQAETISVTIGFFIDSVLKSKIKFIGDDNIKTRIVNNTCERCAWSECEDRIAPPVVIEQENFQSQILSDLHNLEAN